MLGNRKVEFLSNENLELSVLHRAVLANQMDVVRLLIERGADVNELDSYARNPLHLASDSGNEEMVTYLLSSGIKLKHKDQFSRYSLHYTAKKITFL